MAIDYSATKAKFPGLASGAPKVAAKPEPDGDETGSSMADKEDNVEGGDGPKAALMQAQTALESALSSVKSALKGC